MSPLEETIGVAAFLLIGMLACIELGFRVGRRQRAKLEKGADAGLVEVDTAVFGLLGLIIAFTFGGAASRLDTRRRMIVEEANAIGTAYLRIDLLAPPEQPALRDLFRRYLEARLEMYAELDDHADASRALADPGRLQAQIWSFAQEACRADARPTSALLLLPALNQMIDITTARNVAQETHTPWLIILLLVMLALLSATLVGHSMSAQGRRSALHVALFVATISISAYVVLDLEHPRVGLIQVGSADKAMIQLRELMR